jgi:anti-sigma regulatory factor (Ser/Thr protein kinase)
MSGSPEPSAGQPASDTGQAAFLSAPRFVPNEVSKSDQPRNGHTPRRQTPAVRPLLTSHLELGPLLTAVGSARGHVRAMLKEWGLEDDELIEITELLVSELTTNAILATRALDTPLPMPVRLWLHANRKRVLVTVWDADPHAPVLQEQVDLMAESGRGLFFVATYSKQWGWYEPPVMGGKSVWCEIPRQPSY